VCVCGVCVVCVCVVCVWCVCVSVCVCVFTYVQTLNSSIVSIYFTIHYLKDHDW